MANARKAQSNRYIMSMNDKQMWNDWAKKALEERKAS